MRTVDESDDTIGEMNNQSRIKKTNQRVSVAEQKWNSTSNRLIGLNRLFRNKEEEATASRKDNGFEPQAVPRIFNFPLKDDTLDSEDLPGCRNVVTDFTEI